MGKKLKDIDNQMEEKPYNKFQWFLFAMVIPVFFTVLIALIISTVAGVNVFQWSKEVGSKIPVISSFFKDDNESANKDLQARIIDLEGELKDNEAQVAKLEGIIETRDKEKQKNDIEKQRLEEQIKELQAVQNDDKRTLKDIIRTYETMSPKKAAPILASLKDEEAVKILANVKADTLAAILVKMETADAARLTKKLTVESKATSTQP